jgi:hypothetical protein
MVLSNPSDFTCFFLSRQVNLKFSHCILPSPTIPEDDLPRMAKSRKMKYQERQNTGLRQAGVGQAPEHQLPCDLTSQTSQFVNFNRGFDESSSLKSSSQGRTNLAGIDWNF